MITDSKTVLCIEDDEDSCELLQFVLESEGFRVFSRRTAEEGLQQAAHNKFAAIVLDYRLPEMSGAEFCRRIRGGDQRTPIIFYTASAFSKDRQKCLAAGASAYLVKPMDLEKIAATIRRLISEINY